jgi:serine/threonine protein kinase/Tol biopolymer transport system component
MTAGQWRRIEQIYEAVLEQPPSERRAFLESACGDDDRLRREVERLIAANDQAGDFLAVPAWEVAPSALVAIKAADHPEMSLVGGRVGTYDVLAPLGVGGMGEVYRARDTKLNRDVALKFLPDVFALDPDRLARFKREAHVLASLNHPNIAAIYGLEDTGDVKALVLELVEGPTLADRIARGSIDLEEALPIARQIAEALEAAHERGIVHRDLKPANIKVRPDSMVKVLDFGLAKALDVEHRAGAMSQSPTVPTPVVTADGMIVGTPAYMAPEQARGKPADNRADLWAFGCVLYEMLTGRRAFAGENASETLASVMRDDPDWAALPNTTPPSIRRLLRRCLAKDPKGRLSDAAVARIEIDEARLDARIDTGTAPPTSLRGERVAWASALLLVGAAIAAVLVTRGPEPVADEVRFDIQTPPTTDLMSLAISPDGQKIVFVATSEGRSKLWLRRLDSGSAEPLIGTDGAAWPFWSPDSRSVAFFASTDNRLKRLDIDGRSIQVLGMFPLGSGGTWNQDGTILFSHFAGSSPILRVSSNGGQASPATRLQPPELTHQSPQFLPDGRHFLYHSLNLTPPAVFVGDLEGSESRRLLEADTAARYVPSGHLLFARGGILLAQAFDAERLALAGNPFRVAAQVAMPPGAQPALSLSATGTLVFRVGSSATLMPSFGTRPLIWFDRSGKEIGRVSAPEPGGRPSLSPDGRQLAVVRSVTQVAPPDIWLLGLGRDVLTRITSNGAINLDPIWSPDMREVAFSSSLKDKFDLYRQPLDSTGKAELLLATPEDKMPSDWSPDGRVLLYTSYFVAETANDIWALPLSGERKPFPVVQTPFDEMLPQFSPDGRWIAHQSNETGQFEIYLQQFPGPGGRQRVSTAGGAQVRWRRDGKELFYIALDGRLMAVPIRFASDGQAFDAGTSAPLFATQVGGAVSGTERQQYVVSPDGQRFLMSVLPEDPNPPPIAVILNWRPRPQS